jgi:hypothetical protein
VPWVACIGQSIDRDWQGNIECGTRGVQAALT